MEYIGLGSLSVTTRTKEDDVHIYMNVIQSSLGRQMC